MNSHEISDDNDMQSKIIKCKTNNQQNQHSSYNVLTSNGTSSTTIRSIDVPNEHTTIKLHIRRVCSPSSSSEALSTNSTIAHSNEQTQPKIISRKFFHTNPESNNKSFTRRVISTRRTSLIETDLAKINSTITNHSNIYDENSFKKQTNDYKRKFSNDQQDKKRQRLAPKATKQSATNASMFHYSLPSNFVLFALSFKRIFKCTCSNSFIIALKTKTSNKR